MNIYKSIRNNDILIEQLNVLEKIKIVRIIEEETRLPITDFYDKEHPYIGIGEDSVIEYFKSHLDDELMLELIYLSEKDMDEGDLTMILTFGEASIYKFIRKLVRKKKPIPIKYNVKIYNKQTIRKRPTEYETKELTFSQIQEMLQIKSIEKLERILKEEKYYIDKKHIYYFEVIYPKE